MSLDREVKAAKSIARYTVRTALQKDSLRSILFHDFLNNRLKYIYEGVIIESFVEWEINGMILPFFVSDVVEVACSWEVIFKLVKAAGHHSIGQIKRFFNSISVVDVDVHIQNSFVSPKQL